MPSCSLNFPVSNQFHDFVRTVNPKYCLPGSRSKLTSLLEDLLDQVRTNVAKALAGVDKVSVGMDVWTTKGMSNSYLALTVHFYSHAARRLMNLLLAIKPITGRHSAATIKAMSENLLAEWNLTNENVFRYVTDNGSNMIAAFRDLTISIEREMDEDFVTTNEPKSSFIFLADPNIEMESDDPTEEVEMDVVEYENCEEDHNKVFSKRLPCIAHSIQLVLHTVVDRDMAFHRPVQRSLEILRKFKKSVPATESLLSKCGKTVLLPARSHWNSLCIVLE